MPNPQARSSLKRATISGAAVAITGVLLGVSTNLVTGDAPGMLVWVIFVIATLSTVGLAIASSARSSRQERAKSVQMRSEVLPPFPPSPVAADAGRPSITALLDPAERLAPVLGRNTELKELVAWCTGEYQEVERITPEIPTRSGPIRLLEGAGGVGKTRLALETGSTLPQQGWYCGQLSTGRVGEVLSWVDACGDSTLIVIDDADKHPETRRLLREVLRRDQKSTRIRVLLIVRDAAYFKRWIASEGDAQLARDWPTTTLTAVGGNSDRLRWFLSIMKSFVAALDDNPKSAQSQLPLQPKASFSTTVGALGFDGEPILVTSVRAALAAVEDGTAPAVAEVRTAGTTQLAAQLVAYERRRWIAAATYSEYSRPLSEMTAEARAEAVISLIVSNPRTSDKAIALLQRLRRLQGLPVAQLDALVAWTTTLYPREPKATPELMGVGLRLLQSALVADAAGCLGRDDLVEQRADALPSILSQLGFYRELDKETLVTLMQAAAWFPAISRVIAQAAAHHPHGALQLVEAATKADPAARALAEPVIVDFLDRNPPATQEVDQLLELCDLADGLDRVRISLHRAGAQRSEGDSSHGHCEEHLLAQRAYSSTSLGASLSKVGEHREALAPAQDAVDIYRSLNRLSQALYTEPLAAALVTLGAVLGELGEDRRGLEAEEEAIALYRNLILDEPARYSVELAGALLNRGVRFAQLGEYEWALGSTEEAATIYRGLVDTDSNLYVGELAGCLTNLGTRYIDLGRHEQARAVLEEAISFYGRLDADTRRRYRGELAGALSNLGISLSFLGQLGRALEVTDEAVEMYRPLVADNWDRYARDLAGTLTNLGGRCLDCTEYQRGFDACVEAVSLFRKLATLESAPHLGGLAGALGNLSILAGGIGDRERALLAIKEAETLYQTLAAAEPARYRGDLAGTLVNLGVAYAELGEYEPAHDATERAVVLLRALTQSAPQRFTSTLVDALQNLGIEESQRGRFEYWAEAVAWAAEVRSQSQAFEDLYEQSFALLSRAHVEAGLDLDAAHEAERAAVARIGKRKFGDTQKKHKRKRSG